MTTRWKHLHMRWRRLGAGVGMAMGLSFALYRAAWGELCLWGVDTTCPGTGSCAGTYWGTYLGKCCSQKDQGCCKYDCYAIACGSWPVQPPCLTGTGWTNGSYVPGGTCSGNTCGIIT
jgi:hypothetical protein